MVYIPSFKVLSEWFLCILKGDFQSTFSEFGIKIDTRPLAKEEVLSPAVVFVNKVDDILIYTRKKSLNCIYSVHPQRPCMRVAAHWMLRLHNPQRRHDPLELYLAFRPFPYISAGNSSEENEVIPFTLRDTKFQPWLNATPAAQIEHPRQQNNVHRT